MTDPCITLGIQVNKCVITESLPIYENCGHLCTHENFVDLDPSCYACVDRFCPGAKNYAQTCPKVSVMDRPEPKCRDCLP